jgi:hypothetical protein
MPHTCPLRPDGFSGSTGAGDDGGETGGEGELTSLWRFASSIANVILSRRYKEMLVTTYQGHVESGAVVLDAAL